MTKKIVAILMAGAVVFSFTACASTTKADGSEKSTTEAASLKEENTEADTTEAASSVETETEKAKETSPAETETKKAEDASLTEDEKELLEIMSEDIVIVTDEDYAQTVEELAYHTGEFDGKVYQIEGVYTVDGDLARVSRTLVNDGEETECGLPLVYLEKEIEPDSWIRVTGIVNKGEVDGKTVNVLEVVAVEALEEAGNAVLEWEGSGHQH